MDRKTVIIDIENDGFGNETEALVYYVPRDMWIPLSKIDEYEKMDLRNKKLNSIKDEQNKKDI